MQTITITITEDAANRWSNFPNDIKEKIGDIFQQQISAFSREKDKEELFKLMDKVGAEAERRGLTEEILQQILNEE